METSKKAPPKSLGPAGTKLWKSITGTYVLRSDELATLEDACAATDMIEDLSAAWREAGRPLITKGSMGQEVEHPLIGSIDKQRKARNALFRQLKLPDEVGGEAAPSNQQRSAAQSRWANAHGAGA